jgi:hypothetical protein
VPSVTLAQGLNLTYGIGRTYDIPSESWGISQIPGLEFNWKDLQVNLFTQFTSDFGAQTEVDFVVGYEKRLTDRTSVSLSYSEYHYPRRNDFYNHKTGEYFELPADRMWFVETKIRLWGKQ